MKLTRNLGVYDLRGPAVERAAQAADSNDATAADEGRALDNFRQFSDSFFRSQRRFLDDAKIAE